jgi:hypothetical protein
MKNYFARHKEKKALESHVAKIKARGGITKTEGLEVNYSFPVRDEMLTRKEVLGIVSGLEDDYLTGMVKILKDMDDNEFAKQIYKDFKIKLESLGNNKFYIKA